ncbi:MAG: lantibiotic dehydratase [Vicingaceae bacterium]|nr:lantibiotic dehydratase [Vicingaceae bacterium]
MNYSYYKNKILRIPLKPLKTSFSIEELKRLYLKKDVQEALFLSSPNLLNKCHLWLKGEIKENKEEKIVYALLKYALRMHSRSTPYGLFAACGVVRNDKNIIINSNNFTRNTRLDMNFTCALAQDLAKQSFIQPYLKFYPNTSNYNLYDKIRFVEYFYKNKNRIHQISAVDNSYYLQKILKEAEAGVTISKLQSLLVDENVTLKEAEDFVQEIIKSQILVSEIEPSVTGKELLIQIFSILININKQHPNEELLQIIKAIEDIQQNIEVLDSSIGNELNLYEKLVSFLMSFEVPIEKNKLFQTDLYYIDKSINNNDILCKNNVTQDQLKKALKILNKLTTHKENNLLKEFKENFHHRYEDKEVLLSEALDNEMGVGYGNNLNQIGDINPLIDNVFVFNEKLNKRELLFSEKHSFLLKKLTEANQSKKYIVYINEEEVRGFEEKWDNIPDTFSVMYSNLGKKNGLPFLSINQAGGASGINLLGRFSLGNKEIEQFTKEIAKHEQAINSDKIIASILHLPESRTGNILLRSNIRNYEIPYLSNSSLPKEQQIALSDLYVSIKNNRVFLRSKKLNKEIITRLDNAHNYSYKALPIYYFLCDLQTQNTQEGLFFDWGDLKNEFSFLPRVEAEGVIVSLATWQLKKKDFSSLLENADNLRKKVNEWQKEWFLPNLILLADGDNELLIDLSNELSLKMFVSEIKNRKFIVLKEFLFDEKTALVKDEQGNAYTNEFIAILKKQLTKSPEFKEDKTTVSITNKVKIERSFPLGSEWLYYKIYCGVKTADRILIEIIKPFSQQLLENQLIDCWFFIRYSDPENHLRIRFHFTDISKIGDVIHLFYNAVNKYQQSGLIWKIQTDTYQREIERYGITTMSLSEQLFYHDSISIVDFLSQIKSSKLEDIRWLFGINATDELLNTFNYSLEQKLILLESLKIGFAQEFNVNKEVKLQIDKKYRVNKNEIETILWSNEKISLEYQLAISLLKIKEKNTKPIIEEILERYQNEEELLPLNDLLASYIHMLLNRLFKSKQRLHEMIIYDFMWRAYRSKLAKLKNNISE